MRQGVANFLSLFTTTGTLLCCVLPSLLVPLALGPVVASVISAAPWLAWLSRYKEWLFLFAGLMIALNLVLVYRPRGTVACTVGAGKACDDASRRNKFVLWLSAVHGVRAAAAAYLVGAIAGSGRISGLTPYRGADRRIAQSRGGTVSPQQGTRTKGASDGYDDSNQVQAPGVHRRLYRVRSGV